MRAELMEMILRGDIHDPAASRAIVSRVDVTRDLGIARIYVRAMDGKEDKQMLAALKRAARMVRGVIGRKIGLRHSPELQFYWDSGMDDLLRIEEVLVEIKKDDAGAKGSR